MIKAERKCLRKAVKITNFIFKRTMDDYMATHSKIYPEIKYRAFGSRNTGYRLYEF